MRSKTFRFVDLHISEWIKTFSVLFIVSALLFIFYQIPFWYIPLVLIVFGIGLFTWNLCTIRIESGLKDQILTVKYRNKLVKLNTPIELNVWWNYTFKTGTGEIFDGGPDSPATSNDINVMLEIIGNNNEKVTFFEKIIFGTRFPNEANYSIQRIDEKSIQLRTQRVDKLIDFLREFSLEKG